MFLGNQLALADCGSEREGKWLLTWHEDIRPISHGKKENGFKLFFRVSIFFRFRKKIFNTFLLKT